MRSRSEGACTGTSTGATHSAGRSACRAARGNESAKNAANTPIAARMEKSAIPPISNHSEDRCRHHLAALGEMLQVDRVLAGSGVSPDGVARLVDARLLELEQLLELRLTGREP